MEARSALALSFAITVVALLLAVFLIPVLERKEDERKEKARKDRWIITSFREFVEYEEANE